MRYGFSEHYIRLLVQICVATLTDFHLTSTWSIPASVETVWERLVDTETWPSWWTYVVSVEQIAGGDVSGINNSRHYHWRTCLPYHLLLTIQVTEIQPFHHINVDVTGDLQGTGCCQLSFDPIIKLTQVKFRWQVKTCKPWMNKLAFLSRPVFTWNHDRVMKCGEESLIRSLSPYPNQAKTVRF